MPKFKIEYKDPLTEERVVEYLEFEDYEGRATLYGEEVGPVLKISAKEWAEDYAYTAADKGLYKVTEV